MIRNSLDSSPIRPRHRSRPTLDRLEDRLQPNSLGGLWDDLALGLPTVARPRAPEVASARQHQAHGGPAHEATPTPMRPARPILALAPRLTTPPGPQLPIPVGPDPIGTGIADAWSPSPPSIASPTRLPLSPTPAARATAPAPTATPTIPTRITAALTPALSPTPAPAAPTPAAPWTSFPDGAGGYTTTNWGPYGSAANAIAMWTVPNSTTQRIVTAGGAYGSTSNTNSIAVARYDTDGTFDTGFGNGGVASNVLAPGGESLRGMALRPDGSIVGAGSVLGKSTGRDILVARYTVNGALDTTFNGTGWVSTDINRTNNYANAVGLQSTGKIVAAGYTVNSQGQNDSVILRYTSAGKLDSGSGGFGQAGKNGSPLGYTIMSMGSPGQDYDQINALAVQPDDKIVTVGEDYDGNVYNGQLTLMRFTANGLPDPTFHGGSPVLLPPSIPGWSEGYAVTLQPVTVNGQAQTDILVAGDAGPANTSHNSTGFYENFLVARFNPDGTLDNTFGTNGSGSISVPIPSGTYDKAYGVALDNQGNIVVGGTWRTSDGTTSGVAVARFTPNGTLDTSFNSLSANPGIKSEVIPGYASATANGLAIGNDGNYYLAGYVQPSSGNEETLLAYFSP